MEKFNYHKFSKKSEEEINELIHTLVEALNGGNLEAKCILGDMVTFGIGFEQDRAKGNHMVLEAADAGLPIAKAKVALKYMMGDTGMRRNTKKAVKYAQESVDAGCAEGWFALGSLYGVGFAFKENDFKTNQKKSAECYLKSAELGYVTACRFVARDFIGEGKYDEAMKYIKMGMEGDDASCYELLGKMYDKGEYVKQDFNEAARLYLKAYEIDCSQETAERLAEMYIEGIGVEKDDAMALKVLLKYEHPSKKIKSLIDKLLSK